MMENAAVPAAGGDVGAPLHQGQWPSLSVAQPPPPRHQRPMHVRALPLVQPRPPSPAISACAPPHKPRSSAGVPSRHSVCSAARVSPPGRDVPSTHPVARHSSPLTSLPSASPAMERVAIAVVRSRRFCALSHSFCAAHPTVFEPSYYGNAM